MRLSLLLGLDNAAFAAAGGDEVARILRDAAFKLNDLPLADLTGHEQILMDINGNRVGKLLVVGKPVRGLL